MKANQKFRGRDEAVSPVIAVILMVAITVVLAATVYVWVSGFGSSTSQPARSISLTKTTSSGVVTYTVASSSPGLKWNTIRIQVSGLSTAYQLVTSAGDVSSLSASATLTPTATSAIQAGDVIYLANGNAGSIAGATITILDASANSIMATISGGSASAASAAGATNLLSASAIQRTSGTAGTLTAGVTKVTLSQPIDMSTLAVGDLSVNNGHTLGTSTITVLSPTSFQINWGGTSTAVTTDTLTLANGGVNDITGAATTGASTALLTNA